MKKIIFILLLLSLNVFGKESFEQWKQTYAIRASKRGIPKSFVLEMLKDVKEDLNVIKKDQTQLIFDKNLDYNEFIKKWMRSNPSRIERGKQLLSENIELLTKVENKYGVEKEVIVALWGVETFYGEITGEYDLVTSLATLAYEGRRRNFFEKQLNAALRLIKQGHVSRKMLKGSWAGATGQCQFMPSNIPVYAQDFDGDGKKDIWTNKADLFASIANFLKQVGWEKGKSIGSLAIMPESFPKSSNPLVYRSIESYKKLGFTDLNGNELTGSWRSRRLAVIPLKNSPVVLRGSNYSKLLAWNNSSLFAAFNIIIINGLKL